MCTNAGAFGGLLGAVCRYILELEGPRGPFGTWKSSCKCRVATTSFYWAVLSRFWGGFSLKGANFGPKWRCLKWTSGIYDARSRVPGFNFSFILCVYVFRTYR